MQAARDRRRAEVRAVEGRVVLPSFNFFARVPIYRAGGEAIEAMGHSYEFIEAHRLLHIRYDGVLTDALLVRGYLEDQDAIKE